MLALALVDLTFVPLAANACVRVCLCAEASIIVYDYGA